MAFRTRLMSGLFAVAMTGSASAQSQFAADRTPRSPIQPAAAQVHVPARLALPVMAAAVEIGPSYRLDQIIALGLEQNPKLAQAGFVIEAARGRALQAGLYPNPNIAAIFDELGDKTGPAGVNSLPLITQEIVTGGKLGLSQAAASKEVDQATYALAVRRAELNASVRSAYFDLLTLKRRIEQLEELKTLMQKSVDHTKELQKAKLATLLDVTQLEVDAERFRAEYEAALQETPAAFRRLAAIIGASGLERGSIEGSLDESLPEYELAALVKYVLAVHPDVSSARVGLERAKLVAQRARVEVIPNITLQGGYVRQNQNKSNDYVVGVSLPVPVWNRNQGNILAAEAQIGEATREIQRVENDLTDRTAVAFREYVSAKTRAERFAIVQKKAEDAYKLILDDKNFNLSVVQRLVAQQAVAQARLEYIRARGEAWKAAAAISGLTLEEQWPAKAK